MKLKKKSIKKKIQNKINSNKKIRIKFDIKIKWQDPCYFEENESGNQQGKRKERRRRKWKISIHAPPSNTCVALLGRSHWDAFRVTNDGDVTILEEAAHASRSHLPSHTRMYNALASLFAIIRWLLSSSIWSKLNFKGSNWKKNEWQKNKWCWSFHCICNSIFDPLKKKEAEYLSIVHSFNCSISIKNHLILPNQASNKRHSFP